MDRHCCGHALYGQAPPRYVGPCECASTWTGTVARTCCDMDRHCCERSEFQLRAAMPVLQLTVGDGADRCEREVGRRGRQACLQIAARAAQHPPLRISVRLQLVGVSGKSLKRRESFSRCNLSVPCPEDSQLSCPFYIAGDRSLGEFDLRLALVRIAVPGDRLPYGLTNAPHGFPFKHMECLVGRKV